MIFYGNLLIRKEQTTLLLNLFSYRRKVITPQQEKLVMDISERSSKNTEFTDEQKVFLKSLHQCGQIINKSKIEKLDYCLECQSTEPRNMKISSLIFNLSFSCNMDCYYCFLKKLDCPKGRITVGEAIKILDYLNWYHELYQLDLEIDSILFTGGEPLLEENIETLNYISNQYPHAKLSIKTNGTLLLEQMSKIPIDRIDGIAVSLDGLEEIHTKRVHPKTRDYSYKKIIEGIKVAKSRGIQVQISTVIDRYSYRYLPEFIQFLEDEDLLDGKQCKLAVNTTMDFNTPLGIDEKYNNVNDILEMADYFRTKIPNYYQNILLMPQIVRIESIVSRDENLRLENPKRVCHPEAPMTFCFLPGGDVCFEDYLGKENLLIGRYEDKFEFYKDKINQVTMADIYTKKDCRTCQFRMLCSTGCPKNQYDTSNQPMCGIYKNEVVLNNIGRLLS